MRAKRSRATAKRPRPDSVSGAGTAEGTDVKRMAPLRRTAVLTAVLIGFWVAVAAAWPAEARASKPKPPTSPSRGYDVSYPQCGSALPSAPAFGIVGVDDGIVFSANPCAGTELAWAQQASNHAPSF